MTDRTSAPPIKPIDTLQLENPIRQCLSNGIPIYLFKNDTLDLIHLIVSIKGGTIREPLKHLSIFTYGLLKESSPRHTANEMVDLFDYYGSTYNTEIDLDNINIKMVMPKRNIPEILPLIYEFMSAPRYRVENMELFREQRLVALRNNLKKNNFVATRMMLNAMIGESCAAGRLSNEDSYRRITIADMQAYHRQTFCADNITIYATGNIDETTYACIADTFGHIACGQATEALPLFTMPASECHDLYQEVPGSVQSSIVLCRPGLAFTDDNHHTLSVLSTITGGYFGSRLMQRIREKHGYTYGIGCDSVYFGKQSIFSIQSDVNANHTNAAIDACYEELERLQNEPISEVELTTVKTYLSGTILQGLSTSVAYMEKFAFWNKLGSDQSEVQHFLQHMQQLSPEQLMETAKIFFEYNKFTNIIVGYKL